MGNQNDSRKLSWSEKKKCTHKQRLKTPKPKSISNENPKLKQRDLWMQSRYQAFS